MCDGNAGERGRDSMEEEGAGRRDSRIERIEDDGFIFNRSPTQQTRLYDTLLALACFSRL